MMLLVDAWSEALGVRATADSDFLALGGTSLAAMAVARAVSEHLGDPDGFEAVALQAVFEQATLRDMARELHAYLAHEATGRG